MSNHNRAALRSYPLHAILVAVVTLGSGAIAIVRACGPDFPTQLLDNRESTLKTMPAGSFAYEAARLVPTDPADASTPAKPSTTPTPDDDRATRLYAAGAAVYRAARDGMANDAGAAQFEAVLALPATHASPAMVRAAYTLGRLHAARSTRADVDPGTERAKAAAAFAMARARAAQGDADPDSLATAAWGEEAHLYLGHDGTSCLWTSFPKNDACAASISAADLKRAIALYARQAAAGDSSGVDSLGLIAAWVLTDPQRIKMLVDDAVARKLLVSYASARLSEPDVDNPTGTNQTQTPPAALRNLTDAIHALGLPDVDGADRLAALAYQAENFAMARTLADHADTPLAHWVRAKLAVRDGDMAGAAAAYRAATRGFPTLDDDLDRDSADRLKGEQGVLALSRGEYVQAFAMLYDAAQDADPGSGVSYDAAYVAERVLTSAELKNFIDAHIAATPVPVGPEPASWSPPPLADTIRSILARRLVREGRLSEAVAYFPADNDPRFRIDRDTPALFRTWTRQYAEAIHRARSGWMRVSRARAWFEAATIARDHGLEIMGTEQDPDYAFMQGNYETGAGRATWHFNKDWGQPVPVTSQARAAIALQGPFVQEGEQTRFIASEAVPYKRFHYRYVAVEDIERAADLLPRRSQAFAAVLCTGAGWDTDRAAALFHRYERQGAYVRFAKDFGANCEKPDFQAAATFPYRQAYRTARHTIRHDWAILTLFGIVLIAGGIVVRHSWRKQRSGRTGL